MANAARLARWLVVVVTLGGLVGAARAAPFGGFSADGTRYLEGRDRVCVLVPVGSPQDATPKCARTDAATVAKAEFRRGQPAGKSLRASGHGSVLVLVAEGGKQPLVRWHAGAVVSRVAGVFVAEGRGAVAVEYEVRRAGRPAIEAVAFALPVGDPPAKDAPPAPAPPGKDVPAADAPTGKRLVPGKTPPTAYDRLLAPGGFWSQPLVACDRAGVELRLARSPRRFGLRIEIRCQQQKDVLSLHGTWDSEGEARLLLRFPNEDDPDEVVRCEVAVCPDDSGEDCVSCALEDGPAMELRPVRRSRRR
jgi:hypothetical protein